VRCRKKGKAPGGKESSNKLDIETGKERRRAGGKEKGAIRPTPIQRGQFESPHEGEKKRTEIEETKKKSEIGGKSGKNGDKRSRCSPTIVGEGFDGGGR